jgi:hypothetical protein
MLNVLYEGVGLDYLFISGDKAAIYTSTFGGIFFTSFVWFYFLGFLYLGKHFEKRFIYVLGFIPVALTASVVNVSYVSITIRSILATVGFAYIIAAGIVWFIDDILAKIGRASKITLFLAVTIFLIVDVFLFGYSYIFRRPVTMFQSFFENERQLVEYMKSANRNMVIYDPSPKNILTAYQVLHPAARIEDMPALLKDGDAYILGNGFKFIRCPNDTEKSQMFKNGTVIAFGCLSVDEYKKMISERHGQIMYKDFSKNVAYFIYNSLHTK